MNRQQIRQAARRKALEGQEQRRRCRAAQDKQLESLVVDVLIALAERDQAIREAEQRAGGAVLSMHGEGLSASQIAQWCGEAVSAREVRRLAQGATHDSEGVQDAEPGVAQVPLGGHGARSHQRAE